MICFGAICIQDFNERAVYWFLFPVLGLALGILHYMSVEDTFYLYSLAVNFSIILLILSVLFLYAKFLAQKKFLNHSLGLGDILFFFALGAGFPTITFIILFVGALFFSLLAYLMFKRRLGSQTIPLAGLMSIFMGTVMIYDLIYGLPSLYII